MLLFQGVDGVLGGGRGRWSIDCVSDEWIWHLGVKHFYRRALQRISSSGNAITMGWMVTCFGLLMLFGTRASRVAIKCCYNSVADSGLLCTF